MKQLILLVLFTACAAGMATAQASIAVAPDVVYTTFEGVTPTEYHEAGNVSVTNTSAETVNLKWVKEIPAGCPAWKVQLCDNNLCYNYPVTSNIDPALGLDAPFILTAGEAFAGFHLNVRNDGNAGCCEILVKLSTVENPDVILATITYKISVDTDNCFPLATREPEATPLKVYPNPASESFTLTDNPKVKQITVSNLLGKQVRTFSYRQGKQYDIADLPDGMYLISLRDEKNLILRTLRLSKKGLRP